MARDAFAPAWLREHCSRFWQRTAEAFQGAWGAAAPASSRGLLVIKDTGKATFERLRAMPWQTILHRRWKPALGIGAAILVSGLLVSAGLIVWRVPQWQTATWEGRMEAKDLAKLEHDTRTALIQAVGGGVLLLGFLATATGLVLTWRNLQITQSTAIRTLQLTQDRQITEHYTRAIEQLGSDKLEVRLGAIYALERIAKDSERDHWPIMEILTAYVRQRAPWPPKPISPEDTPPDREPSPTTDIQAILVVLGRRTRTYGKGENERLYLMYTDLRGALLVGAHLEGAYLEGAHLERAYLLDAHLQGTLLQAAHLQGALLGGAHLEGAKLKYAHLSDAYLEKADGLTVEQLASVKTLYRVHLDPPLLEQIEREPRHRPLLEEASQWSTKFC
jgi:hypothetical protein